VKNISFLAKFILCLFILLVSATTAYTSETRNPFEYGKEVHKNVKAGNSLEVILISGVEKVAVIGGKEYYVGDRLGTYKVMTINIDYVEIASSEKTKRLYLNDQL